MATYTTLKNGSSGSDVKKLQQALVDAGYSVGSAGVDGIYGSATAAAVKAYQKANGLSVDGIAGNQTLGSLYGSSKATTNTATNTATTAPAQTAETVPDYSKYSYDASANDAYQQALAALQAAQKELPTYAATYDKQLNDIYNQIVNRKDFSYDVNSDALYQQYKDQYTTQGKLASMNTMGQAAAMTGGYGNSYAQAVGQQTYQGYLQQLNEVVPELYGMALDQYNQEGQDLLNQYSMVGDMADTEYNRYQDSLNQYWQNVSYQKQLADDAYDQGYNNWYNSYQMGVEAENTAYQKQQDAYDKLVSLITSTGYTPTSNELVSAGMSEAQAKAYADYYKKQSSGTSSGGESSSSGGSSSSGSSSGESGNASGNKGGSYNNGSLSSSQIKELQEYIGVNPDGKWGTETQKAAIAKLNTPNADTAWNNYQTNTGKKYEQYADFTGMEWNSYFSGLRIQFGGAYAEKKLNELASAGVIPSKFMSLAASGARGGSLGH